MGIVIQKISAEHPASAQLHNLLAFFAPYDIPRDLIMRAFVGVHTDSPLPELPDEYAFTQTEEPLLRYALLKKTDATLGMHRLVQMVVRDRMPEDTRKEFASTAAQMVSDAFPGDITTNVESWAICTRLLAHARAAAEHATTLGTAPEASGRLFNQAALYLQTRADYAEAKEFFERAIQINENKFGKDHPEVAINVNNLGNVLRDLGDLTGGQQYFERAPKSDEATFGKDHPNVAIRVNNLGGVLFALGDLAGAHTNLERALKILTQFLPAEHPNIKTVRESLEYVKQRMKDEIDSLSFRTKRSGVRNLFPHSHSDSSLRSE